MPGFDEQTKHLIAELHAAWTHGATIATYAKLRDELLKEHIRAELRVATLSAVVKIACPHIAVGIERDKKWNVLFEVAQNIDEDKEQHEKSSLGKRKRSTCGEVTRIRNLALISALWSPAVVEYYGWDQAARGHMKLLRACALRFPRFRDDFCFRLNFVLLERHCKAISSGQGKNLGEARLQPHIDLDAKRLESIQIDQDRLAEWIANRDGAVPIDEQGTLLKDCRANHFFMYLLDVDCMGMIKVRHLDDRYPPSNAFPPFVDDSLERINEICISDGYGSPPPQPFHLQDPTESWTFSDDHNIRSPLNQVNVDLRSCSGIERDLQLPSAVFAGFDITLQSNSCLASFLDLDPAGAPNAGQLRDSFDLCYAEDSRRHESIDLTNIEEGTNWAAAAAYQAQTVYPSPVSLNPCDASDNWCQSTNSPSSTPSTVVGSREEVREYRRARLTIMDPVSPTAAPRYLEEILHNKHHVLLAAYLGVISCRKTVDPVGSPRWVRGQWFTSRTRWAKVWTPPDCDLPPGTASRECDAEILYYTSQDFVRASQDGKTFFKPVVIREQFSDVGMHTCSGFAGILLDTNRKSRIEVGSLDIETVNSMDLEKFVEILRKPEGSDTGLCNRSPHDIAKSHRPLFTLTPRYRLLECLIEKTRMTFHDETSGSVPKILGDAIDFNAVGLPGCFSGAQVNALGGTWIRNLQGIKFWMIIPEEEMEAEWKSFAASGNKWLPGGKQRLVVLEQDDVIFLPPGMLAVFAVHCPTTSLVQGALFWDELNLTPTLQAIDWMETHQASKAKSSLSQLSLAGEGLRQLLVEQPHRFSNSFLPEGTRISPERLSQLSEIISSARFLPSLCTSVYAEGL
jgi:hypothetical protein